MAPELENNTLTRPKISQKWKHKCQCPNTNKQATFFGGPEHLWSQWLKG